MDTRPAKRQRRFTVHSSDSDDEFDAQVEIDDSDYAYDAPATFKGSRRDATKSSGGHRLESNTKNLPLLSSRPKTTTSVSRGSSLPLASTGSPTPSPEKRKQRTLLSGDKSNGGPLHSFFKPASDEQRWSSRKFEQLARPAETGVEKAGDDDDLIEDDDSFDELFTRHFIEGEGSQQGLKSLENQHQVKPYQRASPVIPKPSKKATSSTKRFLIPGSSETKALSQHSPATGEDGRPWPQKYGPLDLGELAVHKRKVSDVQNWLHAVFTGRSAHRLLVLRGPAGSGKTTTVSLLSKALGFDIVEWRNPSVAEFAARDYVSVGSQFDVVEWRNPSSVESSTKGYASVRSQFDEFLGRGDNFGGLELDEADGAPGDREHHDTSPSQQRILLIEEFPTILSRNSSGLAAFRLSLQRYLAATAPGLNGRSGEILNPPVVIIVSETLLSSASSVLDNFTAHRLLGPDIYNHPNTTIIDFNAIAPTFMQKALNLVMEKDARHSKRVQIPGPGFLERISEIGDIRSAISSLEFLCLKGDNSGAWGGTLNKKGKRSSRKSVELTPMEVESLKMVTQREASLGIFHAVGKIVYNKREDASLTAEGTKLPSPPDHLRHHDRRKVSQVGVNELIDETGTDIQTFISALHENYVPSCEGLSFTDCLNGCIEALSDSDMLCMDRRGSQRHSGKVGFGNFNAGVDMLRQEEISYQVATRGLLFAFPYPVKRKPGSTNGPSRGNVYKMNFPTSLRLWTASEEIEGLTDLWMKRLLSPFSTPAFRSKGRRPWENHQVGYEEDQNEFSSAQTKTVTMMSRTDALLYQFPYMAQISQSDVESEELRKISGFGFTDSTNATSLAVQQKTSHFKHDANVDNSTFGPRLPPSLEDEEEKLILSDDDIVDD